MNKLILNEEERAALRALKKYARAHPIDLEKLKRSRRTWSHLARYTCELSAGFRVGLFYEEALSPRWHVAIAQDSGKNVAKRLAEINLILEALELPPQPKTFNHLVRAATIYSGIGNDLNLWFSAQEESALAE